MSASAAPARWPAILALVASALGLSLAVSSTSDYAHHLDRQIHDIHCGFIPGLGSTEQSATNACRVAMYSPYSALFRDKYWGGVPISLFAVGAFAFFAGFALYLVLGGKTSPRRASWFFGLTSFGPLAASALMASISYFKLGHFCKTCVGIYGASALLVVAGVGAMLDARRSFAAVPKTTRQGVAPTMVDEPLKVPEETRPDGHLGLVPIWLLGLGLFAVTPALLYAGAMTDYSKYVQGCGKLELATEPNNALLHLPARGATVPATLFVDPLCPTCKALHQRLVAEGYLDQLDVTLVLFPLDNECNWMLDRPVHPGSCAVSKAVLCSDYKAMQVLEWAYENQDAILDAAKQGAGTVNVRAMITQKWPGLDACIDAKDTALRLNRMLRHIVNNHLPVSTPQVFLGDTRLCDEDTDLGLPYAMKKLAPGLKAKE